MKITTNQNIVEKIQEACFDAPYSFRAHRFESLPWKKLEIPNLGVINIDLMVPNVLCTHVSCTSSVCLPITIVSSLNTQAASRLYL